MSDVEKLMEMISDASRLRGMYDQLCIQIDKLESRNALLEKRVEELERIRVSLQCPKCFDPKKGFGGYMGCACPKPGYPISIKLHEEGLAIWEAENQTLKYKIQALEKENALLRKVREAARDVVDAMKHDDVAKEMRDCNDFCCAQHMTYCNDLLHLLSACEAGDIAAQIRKAP